MTTQKLLNNSKEERINTINKLIVFISERGRRFFYRKESMNRFPNTAYMKVKNGRVYFVDDYTHKPIYAYPSYPNQKGFSHGGTLWALVCEFSYFIRTGIPCNGKYGYGGLYSGGWGHSDEIQQEILNYAKEIGYLKG